MNKLTPYQRKFFFLAGGIAFLLILSYPLSIQKAFTEMSRNRALKEKSVSIAGLGTSLQQWKNMNEILDEELGGSDSYSGFQERLLHETGQFCSANELKLEEFSEPFEGTDGDYLVETIIIHIEGRFKPLLRLVHHLEQSFKGGKISSADFHREKNFRTNKDELFLRLYVQKIRRKDF